jgi:hypothetical protein
MGQELPPPESVAKAMAKHAGWEKWDTATDCRHTPSGNDPEDERDYWRELAALAIAPYAERIRHLERELADLRGESKPIIGQGSLEDLTMALAEWSAPQFEAMQRGLAERKSASIKYDPVFPSLVVNYSVAVATGDSGEDAYGKLIAYIDGRTAGTAPVGVIVANDPVHGWHMKALKPWDEIGDGTLLFAAPTPNSGREEA